MRPPRPRPPEPPIAVATLQPGVLVYHGAGSDAFAEGDTIHLPPAHAAELAANGHVKTDTK